MVSSSNLVNCVPRCKQTTTATATATAATTTTTTAETVASFPSLLYPFICSSLFKSSLDGGPGGLDEVPPSPSSVAQYSLFQSGWNVPLTSAALGSGLWLQKVVSCYVELKGACQSCMLCGVKGAMSCIFSISSKTSK